MAHSTGSTSTGFGAQPTTGFGAQGTTFNRSQSGLDQIVSNFDFESLFSKLLKGTPTSNNFDIQSILKGLTSGSNAANKANEQRYQEGLRLLSGKKADASSWLSGMGDAARRDIDTQATQDTAASNQSAVGRGLAGTTVPGGQARAIQRDAGTARLDVAERVNRHRADIMGGIDTEHLGFLERKTDSGPNMAQILPMMMQYQQGQSQQAGIQQQGKLEALLAIMGMQQQGHGFEDKDREQRRREWDAKQQQHLSAAKSMGTYYHIRPFPG